MGGRSIELNGEPLARMRGESEAVADASKGGTHLELSLPGRWVMTSQETSDDPSRTVVVLERTDDWGEKNRTAATMEGPLGNKSDIERLIS